MSRNEQKARPAGMWALVVLLATAMVVKFAYTGNTLWYGALVVLLPLLWWTLIEAARERKGGTE